MKKLLLILLSAFSLTAFAQSKSVAVLEPICRDNSVGTFYHQIIRGSMESAVTATDEYVSYDRTAFDKVLEEHEFQRSGVVDDDQIRKMGAYAGVDYVLVTELSGYEGYLNIIVKIINIETGESSKSLNELTEQQPKVVQSVCQDLAKRLFGIIDFSNGIRKGTLQLPEGRYTGEIQNGKPHGKGIAMPTTAFRTKEIGRMALYLVKERWFGRAERDTKADGLMVRNQAPEPSIPQQTTEHRR